MKPLFVADVHTSRPALEWVGCNGRGYDAIIAEGDLARRGGQDFIPKFLNAALTTGKLVFHVRGNADSPETAAPGGLVSLHGRTEVLGKYKLGGLAGSNTTPFKTPFELSDDAARSILSEIGRVDILVSHCPRRTRGAIEPAASTWARCR